MSKETKVVEQQTVGFGWRVSVEREKKLPPRAPAKYGDKIISKAELHGHCDLRETAWEQGAESMDRCRMLAKKGLEEPKDEGV